MDTYSIITSGELPEDSIEDLYESLIQQSAPDVRYAITLICFAVYENIDSPVDAAYLERVLAQIEALCDYKTFGGTDSRAWRSIEKFIMSVAIKALRHPEDMSIRRMCDVADKFVAYY